MALMPSLFGVKLPRFGGHFGNRAKDMSHGQKENNIPRRVSPEMGLNKAQVQHAPIGVVARGPQ